MLARLDEHLRTLHRHGEELEAHIQRESRDNAVSRRLAQIPGIRAITASALSASIGDAKRFQSGRQLAAWLGLVPKQHSSGGKPLSLRISKSGDASRRTLLIHGARAVIRTARHKADYADSWLARLIDRRHTNVAAVALANKTARKVWALLAYDSSYQSDYLSSAAAT